MWAWDEATKPINDTNDWRNQLAHPMPHNRDFTETEEKAFYDALQVLEDEEFPSHGEKIAIWQFVDSAH